MIDQIKVASLIAGFMSGLDRQTIEDMTKVPTEEFDKDDAEAMANAGKLLHMANAAHAAALMEQFKIQGFTREEAIPLIASVLRK